MFIRCQLAALLRKVFIILKGILDENNTVKIKHVLFMKRMQKKK